MTTDRLDPNQDVWFYDDRAKTRDLLRAVETLWSDGTHVLFRVEKAFSDSDFAFNLVEAGGQPMLVEIEGGDVLNEDFGSWIATNDISWMSPAADQGRDRAADRKPDKEQATMDMTARVDLLPGVREWFSGDGDDALGFVRTSLVLQDNRKGFESLFGPAHETTVSRGRRLHVWTIDAFGARFRLATAKGRGTSVEIVGPAIAKDLEIRSFLSFLAGSLDAFEPAWRPPGTAVVV